MTVDVIIPTYKPDKQFLELLSRLAKQTQKISRILVINTEKAYFECFADENALMEMYPVLRIMHIPARRFDHGGTRNEAVMHSDADYFVMMTQDAIPADDRLIEQLIAPLKTDRVAVSYARQLPRKNAGEIEKFTRKFNYPDVSFIKSKEDLPRLGIKTFFCSDVCAAYRRDVFDRLGGYVSPVIFNEDMIFARSAIEEGWGIAYVAQAKVFHSHNYSGVQQLRRNFDLGVSQADHPEVFAGISSESEGISMVKKTAVHLWKCGSRKEIIRLIYTSGCKFVGYRLGKCYRYLPRRLVLFLSASPKYWENSRKR